MNHPELIKKIKALEEDVQKKLRNRLTYIHSLLDLDRPLSEDERQTGKEHIGQCLKILDVKFLEFLMEIDEGKAGGDPS